VARAGLVGAVLALMLAGPACAGPARILSLNPCTDAILVQLADPAQIAALSALSSDPAQSSMDVALARRFPATGGALEEMVARRPDLVLGSSFTPPATRAAMARLGLRMEPFGIAASVAESEAQIRRIGALVGHRDRAEALISRIEAALAAAAPPPWMRPIPTLMWQGGGMVPGRDTLMSDLMTRTGLSNFSADKGLRQSDLLPLETLVADPPRLLLVVARAGEDGHHDRVLSHPVLGHIAGMARMRIDPDLEFCGGPTIIRAVATLAAARDGVSRDGVSRGGASRGRAKRGR
jgi:iron complex transport system substrate-binding protein